jgi:hypothetical protein
MASARCPGVGVRIAPVTAALIGLAGVVVGVVLTGAVAYWIEARKRLAAAKVSARLILDDLMLTRAAVKVALSDDRWLTEYEAGFFTIEQWRAERASLAARATIADWFNLILTAQSLTSLADFHRERVRDETLKEPLNDAERLGLKIALDRLEAARPIIEKYAS